jgi:CO/xanthine dehydrogenase Mo-binding subunit
VIGTGPSGQGHETSFAQVVGAVLAVPVEAIDVVTGDTDIVSLGGGSHSGRSMRHSATLFAKAAPELIANGKRVAARLLDASVDQVTFADGRFSAPPHNRSFDFLELAKEASRLGEGWPTITSCRADMPTHGECSSGFSTCATMSGYWRRNTTREPAGRSAISRKRSRMHGCAPATDANARPDPATQSPRPSGPRGQMLPTP